MFFAAGKLIWFFVAPSALLALTAMVGALALWRPTMARAGRRLCLAAGLLLLLFSLTPATTVALSALEDSYPALGACRPGESGTPVAGIIVLGGGLASTQRAGATQVMLTAGSQRLLYGADLAALFPDVPVIVTGGAAFPSPGREPEAIDMARLMARLGVSPDRILVEDRSRSTAENARFTRLLLHRHHLNVDQKGTQGHYLLVTSAFHMRRAVSAFSAAGISVIPAPTDWRADTGESMFALSAAERWQQADLLVHELVGDTAYRITGRGVASRTPPTCLPSTVAAPAP